MRGKIAFFTGSTFSVPAIQSLIQLNKLACVVLVEPQGNPDLLQLTALLEQSNVPMVQYSSFDELKVISELDGYQAGIGIVYLFRHKLSERIISFFSGDIFNLHPSELPRYRGPLPLYWQIRHGKTQCVLTLHRLTKYVDSGPVVTSQTVDIHPFDTLQSLSHQISQVVPAVINTLLIQLESNAIVSTEQSTIENMPSAPFFSEQDLLIDWRTHTSENIVCMARAGNVDFGGARIQLENNLFQLLQATQLKTEYSGINAGTVIEVSMMAGLLIKSIDGAVRLDIIATPYGVFDGYKFATLYNLDAGTSFHQTTQRTL
ncbi:formyltransferase family protein [Pseudoalteromonas sp. S558]|uniref:methionyl-tRNA formyltransferase n=1 Tax=Pseudoalteromonas sp. S558 TaxID=2066515 RepID=UPI00110B72F4|nr:formyltransferase family protein [Pseudoalteromonas sp. S558]TMO10040.1 hypothetical protein CWB66_01095 [Pseudoalteromonas sp. S558]